MKRRQKVIKSQVKTGSESSSSLPILHPDTAGIDIGSASHFVAVPADRDDQPVREFSSFTSKILEMVAWLKKCKIKTVIMESTGSYWTHLYEILDQHGFDVKLVNSYHVKNVSAHKTDVLDCQWLQQLGCFGLLKSAFRPENNIVKLRALIRHRLNLIESAGQHIQRMQKALIQMNIQLHNVISDISGKTGMDILRAIVSGERDPEVLASYRDGRCKNSVEVIRESLVGNYREEHVFVLTQELALYDVYSNKISECDIKILEQVKSLESKPIDQLKTTETESENMETSASIKKRKQIRTTKKLKKHEYPLCMANELIRIIGVDITLIPGIDVNSALTLLGEIGTDMSHWRSAKHFASWLGLSPGNKVSGGKRLSGKTKLCANRAAIILRMGANTLYNADCALGAHLRRMKMHLGSPKAITACAHKIAKQLYYTLKYGRNYKDDGAAHYEAIYQAKQEKNLKRKATKMGYYLVRIDKAA